MTSTELLLALLCCLDVSVNGAPYSNKLPLNAEDFLVSPPASPHSHSHSAPIHSSYLPGSSSVGTDAAQVSDESSSNIVHSVFNAPTSPESGWDYSFETDNGIKQEASGSIRVVDGSSVMVMRGSYEYVGADGQTYVVDWSADETGFHPSAPHLPQPVEIPFADQAAAVAAQIRFAQQQQEEEQQLLRDQIGQSLEDLPTYGALTSSSVLPAFS